MRYADDDGRIRWPHLFPHGHDKPGVALAAARDAVQQPAGAQGEVDLRAVVYLWKVLFRRCEAPDNNLEHPRKLATATLLHVLQQQQHQQEQALQFTSWSVNRILDRYTIYCYY